jgi:hypothetical protein
VEFPQVAAFARLANGSAAPTRSIAGQATKLARSGHYIQYDEVHDEFVIANPFAQAVLFFRGGANGKEAPIRTIMGPHTEIQSPDFGMAVDPVNNELYVMEQDEIKVFPRGADGDVAPIRILRGPHTQLDNPYGTPSLRGVQVDPIHNVLVVAGFYQNRGHILIFDRTASGDAKPRGELVGPRTGIAGASYSIRVYAPKGWIMVPVHGGLGIWSVNDSGDIPPLYLLGREGGRDEDAGGMAAAGVGGGPLGEGGGGGLGDRFALNPKAKEISFENGSAIRTYSFPEIF